MKKIFIIFLFYILASVDSLELLIGKPFFTQEFSNPNSSQIIANLDVFSIPEEGFAIVWQENQSTTNESFAIIRFFSYFGYTNFTKRLKLNKDSDYAQLRLIDDPNLPSMVIFFAEKNAALNSNCSTYSLYYQQILSTNNEDMNPIFLANFSIENQKKKIF